MSLTQGGLLLDIIGALLLWRFGLPETVSRDGTILLAIEQVDEGEVSKGRFYDRMARWGLTLLVSGFALQLLGAN